MNLNKEQNNWLLTDEEFESNMEEVFGELSLCASKTENPNFIIVGGQAGSGKTALVAKEYQDLGGNAIIIDQDELRPKYPKDKYKQIHDNCTEREEFLILKPYVSQAILNLINRAQSNGYNIILESALRSVNSFITITQNLKACGYTTKLSILSVPEVEAYLSMLTRYCYYLEKFGECRRNTRIDSSAVESLKSNITRLDNLGIFEDIAISIRGKDLDSLPIQFYSKRTNNNLPPLQAYLEGQAASFADTKRNFNVRYEKIKAILMQHNESEQLAKLEEIKRTFEMQISEMR